ncbi:class II aldolase/adducin family protein [Sphingomonas sp. ACRSK]|uniref:class II aldolase/adducin family protein n=1 Tax=Sphingomonas sp. ACRSK TaxID=2918213 RepID=UPI001EF75108|nr:class II aldolase/adducin family protein [Sphingomonas sp. ACRSK]MCG7349605.1 class II aldolase/adducin family protein [Sphingomonas sp. ACRSK]
MTTEARLAHDLQALRRFAVEIGADTTLVQGAGGNVSIKSESTMWIKASGTWLADALNDQIMVPVALHPQPGGGFVAEDMLKSDLRPSIETSMHAALPQTVVAHVHSVDAIAFAVQADAEARLAERLGGVRWAFVPYRRPGQPLTDAVVTATRHSPVDILILANHGLVVAAADVAAAHALLRDVVERLRLPARPTHAVTFDIDAPGYRPPTDPIAHAVATDPVSTALAERGALYPDHVVFLGRPLIIDDITQFRRYTANASEKDPRPTWLLIRGRGVAVSSCAPHGADAMLRCLADVLARITADDVINVLNNHDVAELLDWDAERYRRMMAAN